MSKTSETTTRTTSKRPAGGGGPGHRLAAGGEKPKNLTKTWGKILKYSKKYIPFIILSIFFTLCGTLVTIIGPSQFSKITDIVSIGLRSSIDMQAVRNVVTILVILYAIGAFISYLQGFIMATITQRLSHKMRADTTEKIGRLPLNYFDSTSIGDVLSRITNDIDTVSQALNQSISTLINAVLLFVGVLFMMVITNTTLTFTSIISTVIGFIVLFFIMSRSQKYFKIQQEALGEVNGHIEEIYSGHTIIKAYNGEKKASKDFDAINSKLQDSQQKAQFFSGTMMPLMGFVGNLGYVMVCVIGAILAMQGTITFGVIVAFMSYTRLFTQPLTQMAQAVTSLQSAAAAGERVFDFLEEPEMENESGKREFLETTKGNVTFDHVKFGYLEDKLVINDFSATVKSGQKIAIVGPTGAGKTTLVNLLMRFYELNDGHIYVDDISISDLTRENVRDLFCMVLQDTWLFEGTIKENVIYNMTNVSDEDVVKVCKAAGMDHFVRTLPKGYDTVLDDKTNLSAGQKQLLTIARAMLKNAPMLILDEATSSVDTRTELLIQQAMDTLMQGRTSFVIAHRLSTIKNADVILVMKDGDIVESGTHDELIIEKGFYYELYNSQFEEVA